MTNKTDTTILTAIGAILLLASFLFIGPLIGVFTGAFVGWVVGLFWIGGAVSEVLGRFGVTEPLWKIGATLGFLSGFFHRATSKK